MKKTIYMLMCLAGFSGLSANEYVNWIAQIQNVEQVDGSVVQVEEHLFVDAEGTQLSKDPVPVDGALFELWTLLSGETRADDEEWLLGSTTVGAFLPIVDITIESGDPYPNVHRTRADQPFTVSVTVSGLSEAEDAPEAGRKVIQQEYTENFPEGLNHLPGGLVSSEPHAETPLEGNQTEVTIYPVTRIDGENPLKVAGEEHFVVQSLASFGVESLVLAQKKIQIWPVTDGSLSGITENQIYTTAPTSVVMTVNDAYPGSAIYAQIYVGPSSPGKIGTVLAGSHRNVTDDISTDHVYSLNQWASVLTKDDVYTVELISKSPFGIEILDTVTFEVDFKLNVSGAIHSLGD